MTSAPDQAPPVAERLAALRAVSEDDAVARCEVVRDLVVVCSSSRGGSSLFGELLRRSPDLLTFSAEVNPHFAIPTLAHRRGCASVLDPAEALAGDGLRVLQAELGVDLGSPADHPDATALAAHTAWRLTMQWPAEAIDPRQVEDWTHAALAQQAGTFDRVRFLFDVLSQARRHHPALDPYRYDIPDQDVATRFPSQAVPSGPTAEPVVEMTPFVLPRPWRVATFSEAASHPVVVTTPRNSFRLRLLAAAFPQARISVVHLVRNPAAAANGLRDGWRHRGFFSCRTEVPLAIPGYSDEFPLWGEQWWNYDVPPGWRDWAERPLAEVCGYQWRAAHEATLQAVSDLRLERRQVHLEDITGPRERRAAALRGVCRLLQIDAGPVVGDDDLPVVMPTAPPRPRRWAANAALLEPVLRDARILHMAAELGYDRDPATWA